MVRDSEIRIKPERVVDIEAAIIHLQKKLKAYNALKKPDENQQHDVDSLLWQLSVYEDQLAKIDPNHKLLH